MVVYSLVVEFDGLSQPFTSPRSQRREVGMKRSSLSDGGHALYNLFVDANIMLISFMPRISLIIQNDPPCDKY
jgi:hypothetical protein